MPDPSETPNLERINLLNCTKLCSISSSIQNFKNLGILSLPGCKSLKCFPPNIQFSSPIKINLSDCVNITEFPQISGNIKELHLDGTAIEEVPSSVESLINLEILSLKSCERLKILSTSICKLKSLRLLYFGYCLKLESFPEISEKMERLEYIDLNYTAIRKLPSPIENVRGLQSLALQNCSELDTLPENLRNLKSLGHIYGERSGISQLQSSITELNQPKILSFSGCISFVLPPLSGLSSLELLNLGDRGKTKIPQDIGSLSSLEILKLNGNNFTIMQRKKEEEVDLVHPYGIIICLPGNGIPEWFSNQSLGSSINIPVPQLCCSRNFIGFALCAVIALKEFPGGSENLLFQCDYRFEAKNRS
ncbi:Disease resistance protein [Melia azedarach]|uniref:Disease resistance protein n=1 Tax=Melia azedarach TaxID=155640 RepID=A0ACC1Y5L4_MELAZ|nr:Disease resistance protein [Melia azedarach]